MTWTSTVAATGEDAETARAKIGATAGPSGFTLFRTRTTEWLRLAGQKQEAI